MQQADIYKLIDELEAAAAQKVSGLRAELDELKSQYQELLSSHDTLIEERGVLKSQLGGALREVRAAVNALESGC